MDIIKELCCNTTVGNYKEQLEVYNSYRRDASDEESNL